MANSVLSAGTSARGLTDSGETSGASSSEGRQLTVHFQYDSFLQMTLPCDPSQCGPRKPMVNSVLSDGTSDPWTHRLRAPTVSLRVPRTRLVTGLGGGAVTEPGAGRCTVSTSHGSPGTHVVFPSLAAEARIMRVTDEFFCSSRPHVETVTKATIDTSPAPIFLMFLYHLLVHSDHESTLSFLHGPGRVSPSKGIKFLLLL